MIFQEIIVRRKQGEAMAQTPPSETSQAPPPAKPLSLEYTEAVERHEAKIEEIIKKFSL